jgi:hypothetical protein
MIDPKELRIGNRLSPRRVLDPENIPLTGYSICAGHIDYSVERLNYDWEPIKLNLEILENCGFKGIDWEMDQYDCEIAIDRNNTLMYEHSEKEWLINGMYLSHRPKYLHELQNLFYCLSGKELEIKS